VVTDQLDVGCGATPDAHGTEMAGAVAAHQRLTGVAPGVKVLEICALGGGATGEARTTRIIEWIDYAIAHARIINFGFAGPGQDPAFSQVVQIGRERGIAAAGDKGARVVAALSGCRSQRHRGDGDR
jgi:hypothetical protein